MTPLVLLALAGCLTVDPASDRILARDFAPAWPAMRSQPPDLSAGLAPIPGVTRIFGPAELRALAARLHVDPPPEAEICFERPIAPLDPAALSAAMRRTLPEARIEIIDYSRTPAPQGAIEFPRTGLRPAPGGAFWSGFVKYARSRRFVIWARVKVRAAARRVVAREPIKARETLSPGQLTEQILDEYPAEGFASSISAVEGMMLRRSVAAGEAVRMAWLEAPKLVLRGDTVRVEVQRGGARLEFEGRAEASGGAGDTISVLNLQSHRSFRARVKAKGRVSVKEGTS